MKKIAFLKVCALISMLILPFAITSQTGLVDAGLDQTVYAGEEVAFYGSVSVDHSLVVSVQWDFGDGSPVVNGSDPALLNMTRHVYAVPAVYVATLSVKIGPTYNVTETDTVTITVLQNLPPVADAGPDQTVEQTSHAGAEVTLDASGSYDPYGDPLTYNWTWTGGSATGINPTATFPLGTTTVTLTVSDGKYAETDTVNITVQDTTKPEITATVTPNILWPPNHKYVEVRASVTAYDICDASPTITLVSITSNEPDNDKGIGDGNTVNDILIVNDFTFKLRAERAGTGSGRVYTITYQAADDSGNTALVSVTVTVAHDMR